MKQLRTEIDIDASPQQVWENRTNPKSRTTPLRWVGAPSGSDWAGSRLQRLALDLRQSGSTWRRLTIRQATLSQETGRYSAVGC